MGFFKSMKKAFGTEKGGGKRLSKSKSATVKVDLIESPRQTQTANRPAMKKGFDFEDSVLMLSYAEKFSATGRTNSKASGNTSTGSGTLRRSSSSLRKTAS